MMEDVYEVNINGEPDEDLLDIIKVKEKCMYVSYRQTDNAINISDRYSY